MALADPTPPPPPPRPGTLSGIVDFFKSWQVVVAGIAAATSLYFSLLEKERKEFEINQRALSEVTKPDVLRRLATDPYNTINQLEAAYPRHAFCAGLGVFSAEQSRLELLLATAPDPGFTSQQSINLAEALDNELSRIADDLGLAQSFAELEAGIAAAQSAGGAGSATVNCARMEPPVGWLARQQVDPECRLAVSVHLENLCVRAREKRRREELAVTLAEAAPDPGLKSAVQTGQVLLRAMAAERNADLPPPAPVHALVEIAADCARLDIFVQVLSRDDVPAAGALMQKLGELGWSLSGPDVVTTGQTRGDVRFYKDWRQDCARSLAESVKLNASGFAEPPETISLEKRYAALPDGRMELWLPEGFR